jgi:hypothetical protein
MAEFEDYIVNAAEQSSQALGGTLDLPSLRWIGRPGGKEHIKDTSLPFYIDGKKRADDVVLLLSNPTFGEAVALDVECAREVAARVGQDVARHISEPVHEGKVGTQSYAVFSRLSGLSENKIIRKLQKPAITKKVMPWLAQLGSQTRQDTHAAQDYDRLFIDPLASMSQDADLPKPITSYSKTLLERIKRDRPKLFTVLQHGDFWAGNVFFERRALENINPLLGDFTIIDWRGRRLDGYPIIDLVQYGLSLYKPDAPQNGAILQQYMQDLRIPREDVGAYIMLALGRLGADLDQFPKDQYCTVCETTFGFVKSQVLN